MLDKNEPTVFFDGDELRQVFGNDLGYSEEDRFVCGMRYARLCRLVASQGINVICSTISMFDEIRTWNRENIAGYKEIYLKVPIEVLQVRDQKGLYSGFDAGVTDEVVGKDLHLQLPKNAHIILENDGCQTPEDIVADLVNQLEEL